MGSWLEAFYQKRVKQDRDVTILITDDSNERGTGKTTLALKLASFMDRTQEGITSGKTTLSASRLEKAYKEYPKGSSLILDETEAELSKYRASSGINKAIRDLISMGRVLEKYTIFTAPASGVIDNDLKSLFGLWILVQRRGKGIVHYCDYNPYKGHPLFKKKEPIEWTDIQDNDLQAVYEELAEEKEKRLSDREEEENEEEEIPEEVQKEARNNLIVRLYENDSFTQQDIAEAVGLSRSRVGDILSKAK